MLFFKEDLPWKYVNPKSMTDCTYQYHTTHHLSTLWWRGWWRQTAHHWSRPWGQGQWLLVSCPDFCKFSEGFPRFGSCHIRQCPARRRSDALQTALPVGQSSDNQHYKMILKKLKNQSLTFLLQENNEVNDEHASQLGLRLSTIVKKAYRDILIYITVQYLYPL